MIKAIIMDVDGVIVGKKRGVNFPLPNEIVINKLKELNARGIPVVLCTAKFGFAIHGIIKSAGLKNPHIIDGGSLIIDLLSDKIIKKSVFERMLAEDIIKSCLEKNIYLEMYGTTEYFVQASQEKEFTNKRTEILQKSPTFVDSLEDQIKITEVIKIIGFVGDDNNNKSLEQTLAKVMPEINFIWSSDPAIDPVKFGVITVKGVSKKSASLEVLEYLKISPDETLGIGDLISDWNFIEICKYGAAVGDESQEFKDLLRSKGEGKYFFSSSVDENGFIDIINHFNL